MPFNLMSCQLCYEVLPVSIDERVYIPCCGKMICGGCYLQLITKMPGFPCPFCRQYSSGSEHAIHESIMNRMKHGDANATLHDLRLSDQPCHKTIRNLFAAIEGGSAEACVVAALAFYHGRYGIHVDTGRAEEYFKKAVLLGHDDGISHMYLSSMEFDRDHMKTAFNHLFMTVSIGCDNDEVSKLCNIVVRQGIRLGIADKDEYEAALRDNQEKRYRAATPERRLFKEWHVLPSKRQRGNTTIAVFTCFKPRPPQSRLLTWAPPVNHYWGLIGYDDDSEYDEDDLPQLEEGSMQGSFSVHTNAKATQYFNILRHACTDRIYVKLYQNGATLRARSSFTL